MCELILIEHFDIETGCCRNLHGLGCDVLSVEVPRRGVRQLAGLRCGAGDDNTVIGALSDPVDSFVASDQGQVGQHRPTALVILKADISIAAEQRTFGYGMSSRFGVEVAEVCKVDCETSVFARSADKIGSSCAHCSEVN